MKKVIIIGTGGHAKVVADVVVQCGDMIAGFLTADTDKKSFLERPVLGTEADPDMYEKYEFIIAIGNAKVRQRIATSMPGAKWYTGVHPTASVSSVLTAIGEGSVVMANAVVNSNAQIGKHCIINSGAVVEHDNTIGDYAHISVGAKLAGNVTIGERAWVGIGASVREGTHICADCMIGAGAVVVKNISVQGTYVGIPAKPMK